MPRSVPWSGRRLLSLPAIIALLLVGCYPGGPEEASELGLIVTAKVPGADYNGLLTFAMEDTVIELDVDDTSAEPIDPRYNPVILEELRTQMIAAGFVDVSALDDSVPDVQLICGAVTGEVWYYYYDWGYYGGYPPYWGYYPPAVSVGSFETGTLLWQLMDLRDVDPEAPDESITFLWLAGINGVLQNSASTVESNIRGGIRQGFAQSPYIQAAAGK